MYHTLTFTHTEPAEPRTSLVLKAWKSVKLCALFLFWHYGLLLLFFALFCLSCYLYFDAVCMYLLPGEACDTLKDTPTAGKVVFVTVAGRRVAVRMNREVKRLKAKYVKGD